MHAFEDFFPGLAVVSALILAALAGSVVCRRVGLPAPTAFLAVGVLAGLVELGPAGDLSPLELQQIGVLALYAILFQGGAATGFTAWRREARPILGLGLAGTAATAGLLAIVANVALGLDWEVALLIGIALAPTDPAAVYAALRSRSGMARTRTILEGESGFNDPVAISLMVVAVSALAEDSASAGDVVRRMTQELLIGTVGGLLAGGMLILLMRQLPRLEDGFVSVALLTAAVLAGALTAWLHGSGFLAVYLAGLLVSDQWAKRSGHHHSTPEAVAGGAEVLLFALLGSALVPSVEGGDVWRGALIGVLLIAVVRPLVVSITTFGSRLKRSELVVSSLGGLKGAVPLLLAVYPALEQLDGSERVQAIVLVATALSLVVQGGGLTLAVAHSSRRA